MGHYGHSPQPPLLADGHASVAQLWAWVPFFSKPMLAVHFLKAISLRVVPTDWSYKFYTDIPLENGRLAYRLLEGRANVWDRTGPIIEPKFFVNAIGDEIVGINVKNTSKEGRYRLYHRDGTFRRETTEEPHILRHKGIVR